MVMVNDCKPVFFEEFLQLMFFQWVLDLVSGEWLSGSSKLIWQGCLQVFLFLCCLFSVILKLQHTVDDRRKKTSKLVFDGLLEVILCRVIFVFLDIYHIATRATIVFLN